ncbi:glycosyltransferase like 2 family protein [Francisella philomiragia]|uniref:glycosyltransferase family 2 protein n=1 Tax=Francisella philomiragia TaxID=28110 RepID=UPI0005A57FC1|nr:glycosyltransferase family 2 protein [Francisella philomiragia]AJI54434.1 glycosyltransferase like 2 family protein [Francisella philomiragia]MBK2252132.1 glycosyltransferase [Francisella philomiragia]
MDREDIKFTVITVCYNSEKTIQRTLQSIKDQTYKNIEYIIIDGGSTDKTLDIINNYKDIVDILISEPDNGIYDAMNKGIKLATGDYIGFLNSDDYYTNDIFEEYNKALIKEIVDYIYSDTYFVRNNSIQYLRAHQKISKKVYQYMPFAHLSLYIKKDLLKRLMFDTRYSIAADLDLLNKLIKQTDSYVAVDKACCYFVEGGISTRQLLSTLKEAKEVIISHNKNPVATNFYFGYRFILLYIRNLMGNTLLYKITKNIYNKMVR